MEFERVLANRENRKSDTPPVETLTQRPTGSIAVLDGLPTTDASRRSFTSVHKTNGRQHTPTAVWPGQGHSFSGCGFGAGRPGVGG